MAELGEPTDRLRASLEALEARKAAIAGQLAAMASARDSSEAAIRRLLASTLQYKDMLNALHNDHEARVPRTK